MRAIVKTQSGPGLEMREVTTPEPNADEVLIRTLKSSICGTDLHIFSWDGWAQRTIRPPLTIGHEFVGEIAALGKSVIDFEVGQRVSGEGHITCGHCQNCREGRRHHCMNTKGLGIHVPGCFADYFVLPARNVFPLPASVSTEIAAFFDPFGNAVHAGLSFPVSGEDVLVSGAGPIGIMAAAVVKHAGARRVVITDVNDFRLDLARQLVQVEAVNVNTSALSKEDIFSVGLEMSGQGQALNAVIQHTTPGGHVALLGLLPQNTGINWDDVIFKSLTLKGIYGREIFGTWYKMCHLVESGLDLSPIITHRLDAERFQEGFAAMAAGRSGKVILNWGLDKPEKN